MNHTPVTSRLVIALPLLAAAITTPALAADHDNLEKGLPTTAQDAYPIAFRALEAQVALGYQKPDEEDGGMVITPRLEIGLAPNLQVAAAVTFITDGDRDHHGDVTLDGLYNLNQETIWLPAVALAADVTLPTGEDSQAVRTTALLVLTKGLVPWWTDRWHVNVGWEFLSSAGDEERDRRFQVLLGYSRPLDTDTLLVLDGVRQQGEESGSPWETRAEVGLRRQVTPLAVASLGGGLEFIDHAGYAGFRLTAGLQHSF
jgi:hypothetical protein